MKKIATKLLITFFAISFCLFWSNFIYQKYYYQTDLEIMDAKLLLKQDSLQYKSDVFYYAESSNGTVAKNDTCLLSIAEMLDTLSFLKIDAIDHGAIHAHTFLQLLKNIKSDAKVKTVIVTLNSRSFGSPWINSKLQTYLSQADIMYEPILPIFKRVKLAFNAYDNTSNQMRDLLNENNWAQIKLNVPFNFPFKTTRQWDNAYGNGYFTLPNGDWDLPKITLACHYIKTYAFNIDTSNNPRIKDFDAIVDIAKEKKLKLIFHLLAENTQYADSLVGKELVNIMNNNKELLINRYSKKGVTVVNSFQLVKGIDFIDQNWTTEHYNQTGRWILANNLIKYLEK